MSRSVIRLPTPLTSTTTTDCTGRSRPDIDLAEDGGRAIAIEEAMSALVFAYASEHNYLEGKTHVDNALLETIRSITAQLEVSTRVGGADVLGLAGAHFGCGASVDSARR